MQCLLLFAGRPVGRVTLDGGEPAAGPLEPLPAYEDVAPVFRRAGDLLWAARFRVGPVARETWAAEALAAEAAHRAHLSLATEAGSPLPVVTLDFWDSHFHGEPPLVLAYLREQAAGVPARLLPPAGQPGGAQRPAA